MTTGTIECPKEPDNLTIKAKKNWQSYQTTATSIASLLHAELIVQDDNCFCIDGDKICIILDPDSEIYHCHPLDNSPSFGARIIRVEEDIVDKLHEKHFI